MPYSRIVESSPILIEVPREIVWAILTDFARYPLWNTLSARVECSLRLGEPVRLWVSDEGITGKSAIFEHRLLELKRPEHIAWGYAQGEVRTRRDQRLDEAPEGCVYRTSDTFYGPLADQMMDHMGESISNSFNRLARALRDFAEAGFRHDGNRRE
ncbi:SRPBCC domain-containing protein [Flavisphingomonas formosensis]|uniref:SRPBCC domain-containing protein n=1 Tax=Flavisphingomonas formosensis TaxID=861534 RepID=UPI0012FB704F|nr:SRPBCC domain-containing protein [Sphingomonas formosensis]